MRANHRVQAWLSITVPMILSGASAYDKGSGTGARPSVSQDCSVDPARATCGDIRGVLRAKSRENHENFPRVE